MKLTCLSILCAVVAMSLYGMESDELPTVVMVHGATAGGWEWKAPAKFLEADGHDVHRVTLTGLGERCHLASADVDLETHIQDVVNVILFEDLYNVVLTGHSYGGMVVTGVLDRIPERLSHVIYFDAFVPEDQSVEKRKSEDRSWKVAASRGWTTRTFPGHHVAQLENPRGIASLIEESVLDQNQ